MKRFIEYIKHTLKHKIKFWTWKNLKNKLIEHGPTFLVILIIVELLEHIGLPFLFYYLGENIHNLFYVLVPAPLLICLHFITAPIVFFIYITITKKKISKFSQNIIKLLTSISIAQAIPIVILPILTQYFSPEQFGTYGLYISICSIFGLVASGKYDVAIMLPKKKTDAINILILSFLITFLFSIFCFSILNICNDQIFQLTQSELLKKYYFIIPISIFLISINQSILVWFNRIQHYNTIANQNILKSSSNSISALILGVKNINFGLIIGHIISLIVISIWNISQLIKVLPIKLIDQKIIKKIIKNILTF